MVIAFNMEQFVSNHFKHLNFSPFCLPSSKRPTSTMTSTATALPAAATTITLMTKMAMPIHSFGSVISPDGYCSINQELSTKLENDQTL